MTCRSHEWQTWFDGLEFQGRNRKRNFQIGRSMREQTAMSCGDWNLQSYKETVPMAFPIYIYLCQKWLMGKFPENLGYWWLKQRFPAIFLINQAKEFHILRRIKCQVPAATSRIYPEVRCREGGNASHLLARLWWWIIMVNAGYGNVRNAL